MMGTNLILKCLRPPNPDSNIWAFVFNLVVMEVLAEGKIVDPITGLEKEFALTIDDNGDVSCRVYWGWDMYLLPLPEDPPIK